MIFFVISNMTKSSRPTEDLLNVVTDKNARALEIIDATQVLTRNVQFSA